jgi:hypothetical protein
VNSDSHVDEKTNLFELAKNRPQKLQSAVSEQANLPREFDLSYLEKMVGELVVRSSNSSSLVFSCRNMGAPTVGAYHGDHKLTAVYTVTNQLAGGVPMMINVVTISGERFYTFVYTFP